MPQWYSLNTVFPSLPTTNATAIDFVCTLLLIVMVCASSFIGFYYLMKNAEAQLSKEARCRNAKEAKECLLFACASIALGNYAVIVGTTILIVVAVREVLQGIANTVGACDTSTN
jgi:heme exporter protein D